MPRAMRWLLVCAMVGLAGDVGAQVTLTSQGDDVPVVEIGGTMSVFNLFAPGPYGVRVTRNLNSFVALEAGADRQWEPSGTPAHRLFTGAARVSVPTMTDRRARPFATLGVARAIGLDWRVSPMIGAGLQSNWEGGVVAMRFEWQAFLRAHYGEADRMRLMVTLAFGIPR